MAFADMLCLLLDHTATKLLIKHGKHRACCSLAQREITERSRYVPAQSKQLMTVYKERKSSVTTDVLLRTQSLMICSDYQFSE